LPLFTRLKYSWPALLLFPAVLSLFGPALLQPSAVLYPTFSPFSDLMVIHWPKANLMAQSWQAGEGLPHWTPLILSGMPLAANQLAMLSYPPAWLFLFWPIEPVFNLLFIFHLLLGGLGVYLLLSRAHRLSPAAALLSGLAFALNGKWLAHAAGGHVSMVGAIGWLPWALFGLLMVFQAGGNSPDDRAPAPYTQLLRVVNPWALLAAVALAMQLATHTLLVIYSAYLLAAAVAWHFFFITPAGRRLAEVKRLWLSLLSIPVFAGLLGAAQLLPLLELASYSNRALSLDQAAEYALSPAQLLVGLFLPSGQAGHELVIYLGLVPLLLAPFGLARRYPWSWFYGFLFIFTVLFTLGPATPLHGLFYRFVPGFSWVRTPARLFFVGAMAGVVLASFGVERLIGLSWSPAARKRLARLVAALAPLALLLGLGLAFGLGQVSRAPLALALVVPIGLVIVLLRAQRLISPSPMTFLLGLLLYLDLALFDLSLMRFVGPDQALAPGRPAAAYLAQKLPPAGSQPDLALFRVYSPSYSLPMQTAAAAGLTLADGVEPVHLAVYDRYMAEAGGYHDTGFSVTIPHFGNQPLETALRHTSPDLKLLGLLNVAYVAAAFPMPWPGLTPEAEVKDVYIYRNDLAMPRAWIVHSTIPAREDWLAQLAALPDPAAVALIQGEPQLAENPSRPGNPVQITRYTPDRIELEADIAEPGWLVLSEIWYPGWQATVNGVARPVERANGLLRGIYLDQPGPQQVVLVYRPGSVTWGNRISSLAVILLGLLLVAYWLPAAAPFSRANRS
jgi:hypothetical protein